MTGRSETIPMASLPHIPALRRLRLGNRLGAFGMTAVLAIGGGGAVLQQCNPAPAKPKITAPAGWSASFPTDVVNMANAERKARGIAPLAINAQLVAAAKNHSWDQANRMTLTHTGANGSNPGQRMAAAGYGARTWGENVAAGFVTASSVMKGWMNSSGHRANMLSANFTEVGVGAVTGANGVIYWTMDLGAR
jgi:uncharacterized protein YkwD